MRPLDQLAASDQILENFLQDMSRFSAAQLVWHPSEQSWSITQVLTHLSGSERGALRYLRKKNLATHIPRAGLSASIRSALLTRVLRSPFRYKMPAKLPQPEKNVSFDEIRTDWKQTRAEMMVFLGELSDERTMSAIFRHPIIGYINIPQTLTFMDDHLDHHKRQIRRIENNKGFPGE